jgi:hypothetical protein
MHHVLHTAAQRWQQQLLLHHLLLLIILYSLYSGIGIIMLPFKP